jgi:membrane protein YqaA with SNARE-associated domain
MHRAALWLQEVLVPTLGPWGLFVIAFLDSSVLSLPEVPDILVVTAAAARPDRAWLPGLMATLGSVAGCCLLWWLAWHGGATRLERLLGPARLRRAKRHFLRWHALALVVPALLPPPMPFKAFVIAAALVKYPLDRFALILFLARGVRFAVWAVLGAVYGDEGLALLRAFDAWFVRHAPAIVMVASVVLAVVLAAFAIRRLRRAPAADPLVSSSSGAGTIE